MALKFNKRIKVAPGVKLNVGLGGVSTTFGAKGASVNIGKTGIYANTGLPGTGLSSRTKLTGPPSVGDRTLAGVVGIVAGMCVFAALWVLLV